MFDKCASTLVSLLKDKVGKGPFIINSYISNCALDAVSGKSVLPECLNRTCFISYMTYLHTRFMAEKTLTVYRNIFSLTNFFFLISN